MTTTYIFLASVVIGGATAGAFLRPRTIGIVGGSLFALCILGLIASALLEGETLTWVFGISAMIVPPVAVVAFVAGAIVHALLGAVKPKGSEQQSVKRNDS
jgi:hypothetical protein